MTRTETQQVLEMLADIQRRLVRLEANTEMLIRAVRSQGARIAEVEQTAMLCDGGNGEDREAAL
jgi:hypothetical protein